MPRHFASDPSFGTLPERRGGGRYCEIRLGEFALHADAFASYQAFLAAGLPRTASRGLLELVRDEDAGLLCFAGFPARQRMTREHPWADGFVWKTGALDQHLIRAAAWREICMPAGHLTPAEAADWLRALHQAVPADIARRFFGPRGLTVASAARHLGIGRSSLTRHLQQDRRR